MKMRKELNNKGVSLVELLIATIILGIVVVPLLHTFVTAANTTARSRQIGEATLLGENIAELVETTAMTKTALKALFEDPSFGVDNTDPDNPSISCSQDSNTDVYSLSAKGVHAGSSTFNVKVKLDPTAYHTGNAANRKPINDVKLSDYSNMDGIYAQSLDVTNPDVLAYADFQREADRQHNGAAEGENASESGKQMWLANTVEPVRTTTIDITEDVTTGAITASLSLTYTYHYIYVKTDPTTGANQEYTNSITVPTRKYDLVRNFSPRNEGRLPNLYVMYYPLYESSRINDIIKINNMLTTTGGAAGESPRVGVAQPIKIFLVKEKAADANLANKEFGYNARVEQYVPAGTPDTNYAVVYSNIREDLVTGSSLGNNITYDIYRGSYFSDIGYFGGDDPNKGGDLVSKTERNRMYDVTVEIYDVKDTSFTTPIHTAYATKLQ